MAKKASPDKLTIRTNHWKIPSVEHALAGWLEGRPTEQQKEEARERARDERATWKPGKEAFDLVDQLKAFAGLRVRVQFWDSIMSMLEDEGPYPLEGNCSDVVILSRDEFPQAYLVVDNLREVPTSDGYSQLGYLEKTESGKGRLAPVADISAVWVADQSTVI